MTSASKPPTSSVGKGLAPARAPRAPCPLTPRVVLCSPRPPRRERARVRASAPPTTILTRSGRGTRCALLALAAALLVLLGSASSVALAHANLVRSDPPANAGLDTAPTRITLWFSESPDPRFSEIHVLDASGRQMDSSPAEPVANEPLAL